MRSCHTLQATDQVQGHYEEAGHITCQEHLHIRTCQEKWHRHSTTRLAVLYKHVPTYMEQPMQDGSTFPTAHKYICTCTYVFGRIMQLTCSALHALSIVPALLSQCNTGRDCIPGMHKLRDTSRNYFPHPAPAHISICASCALPRRPPRPASV